MAPEQNAVRLAVSDRVAQAGVDRERLLAVLRFLNQPMFRFAIRRLRQVLESYQADGDIVALVDAVDDLRIEFEKQESRVENEASEPLTAEDLHLVCFEYIV